VGLVPGSPILGQDLVPGDEIVFVRSSGLHANGASLARMVADRLPDGYVTALPSGRRFGDALLDRSLIYTPLVRVLLEEGLGIHYLSHVTGHGLLKLMRPRRDLTYRIHRLPEVPEVLTFLCEQANLPPRAAYSTFNMGVGFAVYCSEGQGAEVARLAEGQHLPAQVAGRVEEGPRRVILEELALTFESDELDLAPPAPRSRP
jgi:phosphoribosylformylglycinamidine cyclo-ligase